MRTKDLDILKPEGYEIKFEEKTYALEALTVEQVVKGWPKLMGFREVAQEVGDLEGKADAELLAEPAFKRMLELAKDMAEIAMPDFPGELLDRMTPVQLTAFMDALSEVLGAAGGEEAPKQEAE